MNYPPTLDVPLTALRHYGTTALRQDEPRARPAEAVGGRHLMTPTTC